MGQELTSTLMTFVNGMTSVDHFPRLLFPSPLQTESKMAWMWIMDKVENLARYYKHGQTQTLAYQTFLIIKQYNIHLQTCLCPYKLFFPSVPQNILNPLAPSTTNRQNEKYQVINSRDGNACARLIATPHSSHPQNQSEFLPSSQHTPPPSAGSAI